MKQNLTITIFFFFFFSFFLQQQCILAKRNKFIRVRGTQLMLRNGPYYANGFNAYWLMYIASKQAGPDGPRKVSETFQQAAKSKLSVARTWAFSDGGSSALQMKPGSYNEQMFKGLDYVVHTASQYGIKLILSFVNNYHDFGGKKQYVEWANSRGSHLNSEDEFFTNPVVKCYYKNHVKKVLNRRNTYNNRLYKNDPTIMAWELMNEPRCSTSSCTPQMIQNWIKEMAGFVKSIDKKHLLEAGLEGFYALKSNRAQYNPNNVYTGTDFIANNQISGIDFATIHSYPDGWMPNSNDADQLKFLKKWLDQHIYDAKVVLKKPLIMAEFGKSRKDHGYTDTQRDTFFNTVYSKIYDSAIHNGPAMGGLFWQLLAQGMENYGDGYDITLKDKSKTVNIITHQIYESAIHNGPAMGGLFWQLLAQGMENYGDGYAITFKDKSSTVSVITQQARRLFNIRKKQARDQQLAENP